jgi:branched-chain amino acid transport system permease protein
VSEPGAPLAPLLQGLAARHSATGPTSGAHGTRAARHAWLVPVFAALVLAALPAVLTPYTHDLVVKIAIYAIFALSLELLVGMTGLVSLGHAAFLALGAYSVVVIGNLGGTPSLLVTLPLAMLAAAAYAAFVGILSLRTKGVYFIMVTLAFAQMAYFVFHDTKLAGGSDGMFLYAKPVLMQGDTKLVDLDQPRHLYYTVLGALVLVYALLAQLRRSRFGHALAGIRVNEQRMRAAGFRTTAYKLAAFVIAGALAGLAGFLLAVKDGAVNPELASWHESGGVLLMIILGGIGHLRGAVLGAIALTLLKEFFQTEAWLGPLASHWQLTFGLTVIAFVALLPRGLVGLPRLWNRRRPTLHG